MAYQFTKQRAWSRNNIHATPAIAAATITTTIAQQPTVEWEVERELEKKHTTSNERINEIGYVERK